MKRAISLFALVSGIVALSACGGFGRASDPGAVPPTQMPAAAGQLPAAAAPIPEAAAGMAAPAGRELQPLALAQSRTVVAFYQPTPYVKGDRYGTHLVDGWLPSVYYGTTFQQDDRLQIGGWGDEYRTYIQFDTTGLPKTASDATLMLWAYPRGDNSTLVSFDVKSPDTPWVHTARDFTHSMTTAITWDKRNNGAGQPASFTFIASVQPRALNAFWPIPITGLYNSWQQSPAVNNRGVALMPHAENNNFDVFRSSRYADDAQRPLLRLTFQSSAPDFKIPLPRGYKWLVTTEVGGWDCEGNYDPYHDDDALGNNYFSVDFAADNIPPPHQSAYPTPKDGGVIPISPAADGIVAEVNATNKYNQNGYYVVVSHDLPNGDVRHGYSTRYLHMAYPPRVKARDRVYRDSTILGYVGNTGKSDGAHLHFGMRYDNDGSATQEKLTYAVVSGWLMKSFQSECRNGKWNRYYLSS